MPSRSDTDTFGFLVTDIARLIRQEFDRQIGDAGIGVTPGEARALSHAARAGTVRQNVLAERMGVEAMTLSAYLDRLEAHGLIERTTDPTDRRAKLVHLTDAAEETLVRIREIGLKARGRAERSLTPAEWEMLQTLLKRVRAELSEGRDEDRKNSPA
jgi:MarR family transcriptional regulator, transcriptional regulator for hemolysin